MEPLAPGTEDDPLYTQVAKPSKKETAEEQALSKKAFLPNGQYGTIFELNYIQGAQHWFCKVCECPVLGRLFNHEIGKRHTANLERWNKSKDTTEDDSTAQTDTGGTEMPIVIAPGEPLPPGFEGEVEKRTLIQDRLDGFKAGPLVGLEYLLELLDYDPSKEPNYLCILCDKKGDPRTVLTHLSSYNHQVMYLQKHFPTVYRHIAPYMVKPYKRNWQSGLQKIADAIETTFGRLKPMQVEAGNFDKDRMHYIEIVAKGKHFSELSGVTFENVVTKEDLTKVHEETKPYDSNLPFRKAAAQALPKRKSPSPPVVARPMKKLKPPPDNKAKRKSLSPVSDISSSDLEDFDPKNSVRTPKQSAPSRGRESFGRKEKSPMGRGRNTSPRRRDGPMPWQKSNYGRARAAPVSDRKKDEKTEKTEEYKKLAKAIDNDMEQVMKKHKLNPEKHPKYNDEWKKFWNSRYKELQAEGKNASTHDFKPEWIEFWNKRMLDLHQEEIKNKKMALRRRLGLPEEHPTPISFKIGERRRPADPSSKDNKPVPTAAQPDNDPEVIVIDDNEGSMRSNSPSSSRRRSRSPGRKRDRSPQFRRRSSISPRDSPPPRRRGSPPYRRDSPRRSSASNARRGSPPVRRVSPLSPVRRRERSRDARISPSPIKISASSNVSPPPTKRGRDREDLRFSPPSRTYSVERSPVTDRFGVRSRDRSRSRGRSREVSWERERHRSYEDAPWDRSYRSRVAQWEGPPPSWDHRYLNPYAPPKILRDATRQPVRDSPPPDEDDGDVNIVGVLRLLTALEEKLGSLGPKVIDLLGQALAMEKKTANSSEELLDSEINCVLFETVKEKLKGQLLAGFVDHVQKKAFKKAIKKTASLIHMAGQRKKKREVEQPKKPVVVPGVGTVDKGKIARQIANALIAQGKTDVTQAELEQLINAVVGIAEAQKNSSQQLTTASFLEKLANSGSIEEKSETLSKTEITSKQKDKELSRLEETIQKIEEEQENSQDKGIINMDGLSDSDLQTLLQNFKDLSTEEQHGLINYLKKLEAKEPERVEKLRKFVNLTENLDEHKDSGRYSPFSKRTGSTNPDPKENESMNEAKEDEKKEDKTSSFVNIDSEDEEYSFEDVAKAASQKVIEKEMEQKRIEEETKKETEDKNLNDAKALITSLMSSLNKSSAANAAASSSSAPNVTEAKQSPTGKINIISNVPVSSADLAKSLSGITMSVSSLGSILGNVQNMTRQNQAAQQETKPSQEIQLKPNNFPTPSGNQISDKTNPPNPRNVYNEFDISRQQDLRERPEFKSNEPGKNRPNRAYNEFNIGPNPGEFRDEIVDQSRDVGRGPGYGMGRDLRGPTGAGYLGFPERPINPPSLPPQDRSLDRSAPFPDRPFRGNIDQGRPSPSFSNPNQYPPRGGPPQNKMRPGANNFDARGGSGDFALDRGDFRGAMNEPRGGMGDFRGGMNEIKRGGPNSDMRVGPGTDFRGGPNSDLRGVGGPDFRGGPNSDLRGGPNSDFRGGSNADFRGGPGEFRGGPDFRGDSWGDSRGAGGNFRGGPDDSRGGSGGPAPRGGLLPKGGLPIDPNRLGNPAPPRYSGGFGANNNFGNSYNKRW